MTQPMLKQPNKKPKSQEVDQLILLSIENGSETEAVIQSKGKVWDTIHCATVFNSS